MCIRDSFNPIMAAYADRFALCGLPVVKVAINFSAETRTIEMCIRDSQFSLRCGTRAYEMQCQAWRNFINLRLLPMKMKITDVYKRQAQHCS